MGTILVVDDEEEVRSLLRLTLEREGYTVFDAADGTQAMAVYREHGVDVVITDIVMPEKEGIELIMELKALDSETPIIAISGGGRIDPHDYLKWAGRFGVEYTFTKPVDRQDLLDAVDCLMELVPA